MSLINFWQSDRENFENKKIQQIVAIVGDGELKDDSATAKELRTFFAGVSTERLAKFSTKFSISVKIFVRLS